jgi:phosphatidylcholine synthase
MSQIDVAADLDTAEAEAPSAVPLAVRVRQALAWGVHCYTALGLVAAAGMAVLIVRGDALGFAWAFVLMLVATLVDSTDGLMARAVRVKEVLPGFDGAHLDDLVDFLTYTAMPLLLLWRAEVLPENLGWFLLVPLLASVYGFCQVDAKTADGYFRGFPSYWNIVALYLYLLRPPVGFTLMVLGLLAALTFVPSRYLYPSRSRNLVNKLATLLGLVWGALLVWILAGLVNAAATGDAALGPPRWLVLLSLTYPVLYLAISWAISLRRLRMFRHW